MKFSVMTPSWNYGRFLQDCIDSVAGQGVEYEHLIADNVSNDITQEVLSANASRVLRFWREQDRGQSDALNRLLCRLDGDIVGWLNADEMYAPGALQAVHRHFMANPHCQIVYGDTIFVDEAGHATRLVSRHPPSRQVLRSRGCYISSCSTFIRREALSGFHFDTRLRMIMDWDLFLELWDRRMRVDYLKLPLGMFRVHRSQVTAEPVSRWSDEHLLVRRKHGLVCSPKLVPLSCLAGDATFKFLKVVTGGALRELRFRRREVLSGVGTEA